jgi:hypothetical protein
MTQSTMNRKFVARSVVEVAVLFSLIVLLFAALYAVARETSALLALSRDTSAEVTYRVATLPDRAPLAPGGGLLR